MHLRRFAFLMILVLSVVACKKDKEQEEEKLPVFGNCTPVSPEGRFSMDASDGTYLFHTNGGGHIEVELGNHILITHDDYPDFEYAFWGGLEINGERKFSGARESLRGKHIKDKLNASRTVIFPDGAKITLVADSALGALTSFTIYDGTECHYVNTKCGTLEYSKTSSPFAKRLDDLEADGETSTFEIMSTGLLFFTTYTEEAAGNKVMNRVDIGSLELDQPTQVNDYFDDPRYDHT